MTAPIAILSAIEPEIATLRGELTNPSRVETGNGVAHTGQLDGREVVLARSGIGKVAAAVATTLLANRLGCETLVFTGVAGGIDTSLSIGDIVVGEVTIQHDTGVSTDSGLDRYQPGHLPFFSPTDRFGYPASPRLLEIARERLAGFGLPPLSPEAGGTGRPPRIEFGTILTGDQFVSSTAVRDRLKADLGGQAVEMEGAAVAQVAENLGMEHLVVRSLSDMAGAESDIDFGRFVDEAAANSVAVIRHLLPAL